jgi:hypothetical protein
MIRSLRPHFPQIKTGGQNKYITLNGEIAGLGAGWSLGACVLAATWGQYEFDAPNPKNMIFF